MHFSSRSFLHSLLITRFVTRVTWRVPLAEKELRTLPVHLTSLPAFNGPYRLDRTEPTFLILSITPRNIFEDKKRNQERKTRKWSKETEQKTNNDILNKIQSNMYISLFIFEDISWGNRQNQKCWLRSIKSVWSINSISPGWAYTKNAFNWNKNTNVISDWSISKNWTPLNPLGQIHRTLVGITYRRFCIKLRQSKMKGERYTLRSLSL
jgi:hypothetical protein